MVFSVPLLLVGTGPMAAHYARGLLALGVPLRAIGRDPAKARAFAEAAGVRAEGGGLRSLLAGAPPGEAIVAVGVPELEDVVATLAEWGVGRVLVEKPAGVDRAAIVRVAEACERRRTRAWVAYNRRFLAPVAEARRIARDDGGVISFSLDFSERDVDPDAHAPAVREGWWLANSSHVLDLAFWLGGEPASVSAHRAETGGWHPRGLVFVGSGVTRDGAPFSYHADWRAPGGWGVTLRTRGHSLRLQPLESLSILRRGARDWVEWTPPTGAERGGKPGLLAMLEWFLGRGAADAALPTIREHAERIIWYERMVGGSVV